MILKSPLKVLKNTFFLNLGTLSCVFVPIYFSLTLYFIFSFLLACEIGANVMYGAASTLGCKAYKEAQKKACVCRPPTRVKREL